MNQLYVGIDVGSAKNAAYLMMPDGSKHSSFSVQNNLGAAKLLAEKIVSALTAKDLSSVTIGLEATSVYGDTLVYALREDGRLGQFQRKIHVLNPKQVNKFKEAYPDLPKNDSVDAFVIADHLRFGRMNREVYMDDYRYKALQTLTRSRFGVVQALTREKQHFANYLFLKCSGLAQDGDIPNSSATTLALMERFATVDELAYADLDELTAFIQATGRGRFTAGIIAKIGDINRFQSQAAVAKYAGLVWAQHQSGNFEAQHTRLIKSGNRYLRYYLLEAANSVRRCDSEFRRYYDLKFKEVNQYQHKRALALTARKLVRLIFRLLKDNRLYKLPEG